MRAWYTPSWNGDWRLEPEPGDPALTRLTVEKPTPSELSQLGLIAGELVRLKWLSAEDSRRLTRKPAFWRRGSHVTLRAPLTTVGPVITSILRPGSAVLTAVRFKDGHVEVSETSRPRAESLPGETSPYKRAPELPPFVPTEETKALVKKDDVEVAVTVKRPTPCCPTCYVDAVGPATDVLLSFLDSEQHASWQEHRCLVARGGITRHRYLLAHRHTPLAARQLRVAFDMEDGQVMHFHDWAVPPEEEVLAAMLILQHREPWLRNEATALGWQRSFVFKNPFGDGNDGVVDSMWTHRVGEALAWLG